MELQEAIRNWQEQIEKLRDIELTYFQLDGSEKSQFAALYLNSEGKTVAEREAQAHNSKDWKEFKQGLAKANADYNYEMRYSQVLQKLVDAAYLKEKRML